MNAAFEALAAPTPWREASIPATGSGSTSSWSSHLSQALARGWFRGPLAPSPMRERVQEDSAAQGALRGLRPGIGVAGEASLCESRAVQVHSLPAVTGPKRLDPVRGALATVAGNGAALQAAAAPRDDRLPEFAEDAGGSGPRARPVSREAPRAHVHVEAQPDGLHVWVGAPVHPELAGAPVKAVLLHWPGTLPAVARLVVNGREEAVDRIVRVGIQEDS